jgi:hypothetical protein
MESVTPDWFWFWFGVLVILDLVVDIIARALAASSFGLRTFRDHHTIHESLIMRCAFSYWCGH